MVKRFDDDSSSDELGRIEKIGCGIFMFCMTVCVACITAMLVALAIHVVRLFLGAT